MSQINRVPQGLQDLLFSKNFGSNPPNLLQDVRPTIDLFPMWASERLTTVRANFEFNSIGLVTSIPVPQGELWGVISASGQLDGALAVGNDVAFSIRVADIQGQQPLVDRGPVLASMFRIATLAVGQVVTFGASLPFIVWFPSGSIFELYADLANVPAAPSTTASFQLLYYRLDI